MNDMNREEAKELLPIIQAYIEGKKIQVKLKTDSKALTENWVDVTNPDWDKARCYRIKPEPTYRPFCNIEECWQEMQKHSPFGWIKATHGHFEITGIKKVGVCFGLVNNFHGYEYTFTNFQFADGTPFGIKE
jgi:hypothetical protein